MTSPNLLPPGLSLVQQGRLWRIEGTVSLEVPLRARTVRLTVSSPGVTASESLVLGFQITSRVRVWTQNTFLRPPTIVDYGEIGLLFLIPFVGPDAARVAAAVKIVYDNAMSNTDEDNHERAAAVLDRISAFDIVALQEVFDTETLEFFSTGTGNGYWALPGPEGGSLLGVVDVPTNSGLLLLVRQQLASHLEQTPPVVRRFLYYASLRHRSQVFQERSGLFTADGWANKGFTLSVVHVGALPDEFIYVVNTHLQAGSNDAEIRDSQLRQMKRLLDAEADSLHPVLLMGDFNVADGTPERESMLRILGGPVDLFRAANAAARGSTYDPSRNAYAHHWGDASEPAQRLDYLLVRQGTDYILTADQIRVVGDDQNEQVFTRLCRNPDTFEGWQFDDPSLLCYISDHYGVEAHLRLRRA